MYACDVPDTHAWTRHSRVRGLRAESVRLRLHTSVSQIWHGQRGSTARARRTRPPCCVLLLRCASFDSARADTGAFWTAGCAQLVACIGHPQVRAARQTAVQPERGCPVPPALASACFVAGLPRSIRGTHFDVLRLPRSAPFVAPIAHPRAQQFVSSDTSEEEQTFLENERRTGQASSAEAYGLCRPVRCSARASVGRREAAAELGRDAEAHGQARRCWRCIDSAAGVLAAPGNPLGAGGIPAAGEAHGSAPVRHFLRAACKPDGRGHEAPGVDGDERGGGARTRRLVR